MASTFTTEKKAAKEDYAPFEPGRRSIELDKTLFNEGVHYEIDRREVDKELYNLERQALDTYLKEKCKRVGEEDITLPEGVLTLTPGEYRATISMYECPVIGRVGMIEERTDEFRHIWVAVGENAWRSIKQWAEDFLGDLLASKREMNEEVREEIENTLARVRNLPE
jgi:hypothetical protein